MSKTPIIPYNYETWHHCITVECNIKLTTKYIEERIQALQNSNDFRTKQFIHLYGNEHRENVLSWFKHARNII